MSAVIYAEEGKENHKEISLVDYSIMSNRLEDDIYLSNQVLLEGNWVQTVLRPYYLHYDGLVHSNKDSIY